MERGGVRELARKVVERAAPAENDEFDSRADAWFADSARARSGDAKRGVPLGFGLSAAVPTIVPLVLFVADHVLSAVTEITVEEGVKRGLGRLRRARHVQSNDPAAVGESVDPVPGRQQVAAAYGGDVAAVRRAALVAGERFGADPEQVRRVADEVVAVLLSHPAGEPVSER